MKPLEILWTLERAQSKAQLLANENQITYAVVNWVEGTYKILSEDFARSSSYNPVSIHKPKRRIV